MEIERRVPEKSSLCEVGETVHNQGQTNVNPRVTVGTRLNTSNYIYPWVKSVETATALCIEIKTNNLYIHVCIVVFDRNCRIECLLL